MDAPSEVGWLACADAVAQSNLGCSSFAQSAKACTWADAAAEAICVHARDSSARDSFIAIAPFFCGGGETDAASGGG
jgi:hypothetical protein